MLHRFSLLSLAIVAAVGLPVQAEPLRHSLSLEPYTGLLMTPNTEVSEYGVFQAGFSNPIERRTGYIDAYNYFGSFGLLPNLEVTGRVAADNNNNNLYVNNPDNSNRDLSVSAKYHLPFIPERWFSAAIGARDIGGSVNHFAAYYGVVSKQWWQLRFNAGLGKSKSRLGQMDGPFGGVEWQPVDWLQLLAEHDGGSNNAGARLYSPSAWLPAGWQVSTTLLAKHTETRAERDYWWGVGVKIPLVTGTSISRYTGDGFASDEAVQQTPPPIAEAQAVTAAPGLANASEPAPGTAQPSAPVAGDHATGQESIDVAQTASQARLYQRLAAAGFENIRIGRRGDTLVVALENNRYNWNELDGLGVALGLGAGEAPAGSDLELVLLNQQLPMLVVRADARCTKAYLAGQADCAGPGLVVSNRGLARALEGVSWAQQGRSGALVPRVVVAPAIRSAVATEYGTFDYSLALSTNLQVPLWRGAMADVRHFAPLDYSDDYADGKVFGRDRYQSEVDRVLLHQAFWLPGNLFTKFSAGRIMVDYEGLQNETRWESAGGRHRLSLEAARFEHDLTRHVAEPLLGTYRYARPDWSWSGDVTAGRFWRNDNGVKVVSRHWFGDTEVRLFYRQSDEKIAGIEVALPLTLRQDMRPNYLQIRGTEQFAYGVETLLGHEESFLTPGIAITPSLAHNVEQVYFNRDRLSPAYVQANVSRLREAWQKYGKQ